MAGHHLSMSRLVHALIAAAVLLGACAMPVSLWAQSLAPKTVRIVVGYPPGGAVDANGRLLATRLSEFLGEQVIVENRAGAAGQIAAEYVARSTPDGRAILLDTVGHTIAPSLYRKLPYDTVADFINVTQTTAAAMIIVVGPKLPVKTLQELVAAAKAKPGGLNYGSTGTSDPLGLAMEVLKLSAGIDMVAVQYKGIGPVYPALLAGEVETAFLPTSQSMEHLAAGRLTALATGSPQRLAVFPNLPTVAESGYPDFEATNWQGMFVAARTPLETVRKIHRAVVSTLAVPEIGDRLRAAGQQPVGSTPEEFDAKVRADIAKFVKFVKDARIPLLD
jgi:tripartite-type tricarboxylate transporter receptor subunit TctC